MKKKIVLLLLLITTPVFSAEPNKMKCEVVNKNMTIRRCEDEFVICYVYTGTYKGGIQCISKNKGVDRWYNIVYVNILFMIEYIYETRLHCTSWFNRLESGSKSSGDD